LSYVNSVAAYAGARATAPVRPNPDYVAAQQAARQTDKSQSDKTHPTFGPAAKVTLSPEAVAYLQGQKTEQTPKPGQGKNAQANRAEDDDAKAKAEKAAAARRAYEAQRNTEAKSASLG
jgi:hypothetical protein